MLPSKYMSHYIFCNVSLICLYYSMSFIPIVNPHRSYESAALIFRDLKDYDQVADVSEKACLLYQENGTPDTAAIALERAAK